MQSVADDAWIEWPSKAVHDAGMQASMEEMQATMNMTPESAPFDHKRMIFGGFQAIVDR